MSDNGLFPQSCGVLMLSVRCRRRLNRMGIATLGELVRHTGTELLDGHGFGRSSLDEIRGKLFRLGLRLRDDPGDGLEELARWYEQADQDRGQTLPRPPASEFSLRDWFAGQALGPLVAPLDFEDCGNLTVQYTAVAAYRIADAMLAARAGEAPRGPDAELLAAAESVLAGLDYRVDEARKNGLPVPVFQGVAALHEAVARVKESSP